MCFLVLIAILGFRHCVLLHQINGVSGFCDFLVLTLSGDFCLWNFLRFWWVFSLNCWILWLGFALFWGLGCSLFGVGLTGLLF